MSMKRSEEEKRGKEALEPGAPIGDEGAAAIAAVSSCWPGTGLRLDGRSAKFRQNVARFRLYRHRSLQENTRVSELLRIAQPWTPIRYTSPAHFGSNDT